MPRRKRSSRPRTGVTCTWAALLLVAARWEPSASVTMEISDPIAFEHITAKDSGKDGMVRFWSSDDKESNAIQPAWDEFSQFAKEAGSLIFVADVNCGSRHGGHICAEREIDKFPTIKYFLDGEEHDYKGKVNTLALMDFHDTVMKRLCELVRLEKCSDRARAYADKWKDANLHDLRATIKRLQRMEDDPMTPILKAWVMERLHILYQLKDRLKVINSDEL